MIFNWCVFPPIEFVAFSGWEGGWKIPRKRDIYLGLHDKWERYLKSVTEMYYYKPGWSEKENIVYCFLLCFIIIPRYIMGQAESSEHSCWEHRGAAMQALTWKIPQWGTQGSLSGIRSQQSSSDMGILLKPGVSSTCPNPAITGNV